MSLDLTLCLEGAYLSADTMSTTLQQLNLLPTGQPYNIAPWNGPVFKQNNNIVQAEVELDISLWLEGTYDQPSGTMSSQLRQMGLLPSLQPFSGPPWNYPRTEGQGWSTNDYPPNSVDWVKVSFRTGIAKSTEVAATAAVLLSDGSLYFPTSRVINSYLGNAFYVVVEHRNHIGAMSTVPVTLVNNTLTYDFRTQNSYVLGVGQKELTTGVWRLFGGDGEQLSVSGGSDINGQYNV